MSLSTPQITTSWVPTRLGGPHTGSGSIPRPLSGLAAPSRVRPHQRLKPPGPGMAAGPSGTCVLPEPTARDGPGPGRPEPGPAFVKSCSPVANSVPNSGTAHCVRLIRPRPLPVSETLELFPLPGKPPRLLDSARTSVSSSGKLSSGLLGTSPLRPRLITHARAHTRTLICLPVHTMLL